MNVNKLSDKEKSILFARAVGWKVITLKRGDTFIVEPFPDVDYPPIDNLYDPANMVLAWRCHLWALQNEHVWSHYKHWCSSEYCAAHIIPWWTKPDAQRLWLDKILSLVIDAGLCAEPSGKTNITDEVDNEVD